MAGLNKITIERNQKTLLELVSQPGNDVCADCKARNPRWASYNLGIFLCMNCASIHRKLGTHITKVKSLTMDAWTKEQLEPMKSIGNMRSNAIYNPNEARNPPPANLMDAGRDGELERYIRSKYQFKRFINKSVLVTSKLGPSRTHTSATSNGSPSNDSSQAAVTPLTSAVSSPSVSTQSTQAMAPRRSTLATTVPTQAFSQPSTLQYPPQSQAQTQPNVTSSTNANGVWADLVSLQNTSSTSSLPLQFQSQSQLSLNVSPQGYQTSMVTGINPFQQQHIASNPYSQQLYVTSGLPGQSVSSAFPTSTVLGSSQQSFLSTPQPVISAPAVQAQNNGNYFQPQPQQVASAGQALFVVANGQSSDFMSAPTTQGHFLSSSPAQFPSQSPVSTTPQPNMFSTTPQPQMLSTTPQLQTQSQMRFVATPSQQFQMQQQGGLGVGSLQPQNQIMGQAPFGAGPLQLQVTTMQPSGQYGGALQQPFSVGGFSSSQQRGPM